MSILATFTEAWRNRKYWGDSQKSRELAAFLPAALEIQESPPNPLAKWLGRALILLVVLTIVWAIMGRVNIVASAEGKIIPSSRVKQIQPLETAVVRKIMVREGQYVRQGQALIELDSTLTTADQERLSGELNSTKLNAVVNKVLIQWLELTQEQQQKLNLEKVDVAGFFSAYKESGLYQELIRQHWSDYRAQLQSLVSAVKKTGAEQNAAREVVATLQQTLPIIRKRAISLEELYKNNYASEAEYLALVQERIQQKQDLAAERQHLKQLEAEKSEAQEKLNAFIAQTKAKYLGERAELQRQINQLGKELIKARDLNAKKILYAPVSGQVKELATHTIGGVVTGAQQLMLIVPDQEHLEVEVFLQNKDIGFVKEGMPAEIKIHTFPFTRYGVIDGEVISVSDDAIADEKLGLVYSMRVLMKQEKINVDGREVKLMPGMAVTAEMQTGERRVIDFFISPLMRHGQEAFRER